MNCLLVDNSNTRTKFALVDDKNELELRVVPTAELTGSQIRSLIRDWSFERVFICSVVPAAEPLYSFSY